MVCSHSCMMSLHAALLLEKKDYPHSGLCMRMQWKSAPVTKWSGIMAPSVPETEFLEPEEFCKMSKTTINILLIAFTDLWCRWSKRLMNSLALLKSHHINSLTWRDIQVLPCLWLITWCILSTREFQQDAGKSCTRVCGGWCLHKVNISIPLRRGEL